MAALTEEERAQEAKQKEKEKKEKAAKRKNVPAPIVNAVAACALDLWPCYKGKPVYVNYNG